MKPQLLELAKFLNAGNSITRQYAMSQMHIQNLTARLSELRQEGFEVVQGQGAILFHRGRKVKVASWRFKNTFNPGDLVKFEKDTGTYIYMKGRIGRVDKVYLDIAKVNVFVEGVGSRLVPVNALSRIILSPGQRVELDCTGPFVIGAHHANCDSFLLLTNNPDVTLVAHASMVRPAKTSNHATG